MAAEEEQVLVVPAAALARIGAWTGFTTNVSDYWALLHDPKVVRFLPRSAAERDPDFKQLIPYAALRHRDKVFAYRRGGGAETRLHGRWSIGIGGHVNPADGPPASAMAPTMRCRIPPLIWCGKSRIRCAGEGMRTELNRSRTRSRNERPRTLR